MAAETIGAVPNLTSELQRQLGFNFDPSHECLAKDDFTKVGGIKEGEWLPARARIPSDGSRFEIGARVQDLEGLLELNRLGSRRVQSVDTIINFWQNHPKFSASVEGEWVFIGANIEPTTRGLEKEYSSVTSAYGVALESAISGRTYAQLARDRRWYGRVINQIEQTYQSGHSVLFKDPPKEDGQEPTEGASCPIVPEVTVTTLREFPISSIWYGLSDSPGKVRIGDQEREFVKRSWIVVQPGNPRVLNGSRTVEISIPETRTRFHRGNRPSDRLTVYLQIPDGMEVQTIEDLKHITNAEFWAQTGKRGGSSSTRSEVSINVKDDSFKIITSDQVIDIELKKPCCPNCETPTWRFPNRTDLIESRTLRKSPKDWGDYAHLYGWDRGQEKLVFTPSVGRYSGQNVEICGDCIIPIVQGYIDEHPLALRTRAIGVARANLDQLGCSDVKIWEDQVWRATHHRGIQGWEIFTKLEYERDGMQIIRHTGIPILTDEGEFTPNMKPRKYIDFRYKAN